MSIIKRRVVAGLQSAGFVLLTLAAWWAFASIASNVVSCVPWAGQANCLSPFDGHPRLDSAVRISLLIISLLAAIWVGSRWFYAPDTYEPSPEVREAIRKAQASNQAITKTEHQEELPRPQVVSQ